MFMSTEYSASVMMTALKTSSLLKPVPNCIKTETGSAVHSMIFPCESNKEDDCADEKKIVVKYEEFKRITYEKRKEQKDKIRFFMSLPRRERMNEMLEHYRQRMEELEKSLNR